MFSVRGTIYFNLQRLSFFRNPNRQKRTIFGHTDFSEKKLLRKIKQLEQSCGILLDPAVRATILQEKRSVRLLKSIVIHANCKILQSIPPIKVGILVRSALVLVQAYVAHLKIRLNFWDKFKPRRFGKAVKYFHLLILKLVPELSDLVIDNIMNFFKFERLWSVEFICCEILMSLLECRIPPDKVLTKMLDYLEEELAAANMKDARHMIRVLHKILQEPLWDNQSAADCKRLIQLYHTSIIEMDVANSYFQMRRGFEMCVIRMCEIIDERELMFMIDDIFKLCFGSNLLLEGINDVSHVLEFAIMYSDAERIFQVLPPHNLEYLFEAIASDNAQICKIGCRLLARLFDRHRNFAGFITPRVFLPYRYYKVNVSSYNKEDYEFFQRYRLDIETHLLLAFRQHRTVVIFEIIFTILCSMLVELPCGYTAAQVISIVFELQEFALSINHKSTTETNQMHALVLSVMTLVAWVHRATSFSNYVKRILNRRADNAPHLNPPIKLSYQYAQHHVIWNEPDLFFDFWQIRYGLWRRFRLYEPQFPKQSERLLLRKIPTAVGPRASKRDRVNDEIIASTLVRESIDTLF